MGKFASVFMTAILMMVLFGVATASAELGVPELEKKLGEVTGNNKSMDLGSPFADLETKGHEQGYANTAVGTGINNCTTCNYDVFVGYGDGTQSKQVYESSGYGVEALSFLKYGRYVEAEGGDAAGRALKQDVDDMFFGVSAGECYEGNAKVAEGSKIEASEYGHNTAFGQGSMAGYFNGTECTTKTKGQYNTASGGATLGLVKASANTADGWAVLNKDETGAANAGTGAGSLESNKSGSEDVGDGEYSCYSGTAASKDVCIGSYAGYFNTESNKLFIGDLTFGESHSHESLLEGRTLEGELELKLNTEKLALYKGVTPVGRAPEIAALPEKPTAAEDGKKINEIIKDLEAIGIIK